MGRTRDPRARRSDRRDGPSVTVPTEAEVIDLSERTVSPGFIDTHVHLTMDASNLAQQTLDSSAAKALKGSKPRARVHELRLHDPARPRQHGPRVPDRRPAERTGRRAGAMDRGWSWPRTSSAPPPATATCARSTPSRWDLPVSAIADSPEEIRRLVRREHTYGSDWIKTANAGGYFSAGDDPARTPGSTTRWRSSASTAQLLGMPVAVHTGAAEACKQADPLRRPEP